MAFALAVALAAPGRASADPAAAEALFQEGRRLLLRGEIDEACEQFSESQKLDPSSGTLINLADCHERQGKHATAWAEFLAASRLAIVQKNGARAEEAERRAALLYPQLSYLIVRVAAPPPGMKIERDGEPVQGVQIGARLPVDPGVHLVIASAPGYPSFQTSLTVKPQGDEVHVWIPPLWEVAGGLSAPSPAESKPAVKPDARAAPPSSGRPGVGYAVVGAGVVSLGVGALLGLRAIANNNHAERACPTFSTCPPEAFDDRHRANKQAWASNITVGLGVVGLAVGGYVLLVAPPPSSAASSGQGAPKQLALSAGPEGIGLAGRF